MSCQLHCTLRRPLTMARRCGWVVMISGVAAVGGLPVHPNSWSPPPSTPRPLLLSVLQPSEKKVRMDPKEAAKQKAAESRAATKQAKLVKEAAGMRKLSSFFAPRPKA